MSLTSRTARVAGQSGSGFHPSRPVSSTQTGPHARLEERVLRHLAHAWRQPIPPHTRQAFEAAARLIGDGRGGPMILDSGCGTGQSTRNLAQRHRGCLVIGVDRSRARLARGAGGSLPRREGDCIWLRAELASFWRLAREAGWKFEKHYLLYPNPWPKPAHLGRRWHAHPAFRDLLALGDEIELRTNWRIYAEEFAISAGFALGEEPPVQMLDLARTISPFEMKYRASGHALYGVVVRQKKPRQNRGFNKATRVHSS